VLAAHRVVSDVGVSDDELLLIAVYGEEAVTPTVVRLP
jgi:hypothetical protein